jgi:hypothetical protein
MDNKYLGSKEITLGGKKVKLFYDWAAIAGIKSELGEKGLANLIAKSPSDLSIVIAAGLQKHQPDEYTPEDIMKISPPIVPITTAINQALEFSYWGPDGAPDIDEDPKPDDESKKKTS